MIGEGRKPGPPAPQEFDKVNNRSEAKAWNPPSLCQEQDWLIPDTPLAIATEMSRIALDMRDNSRDLKEKKQRLEILANAFLGITGQDQEQDSTSQLDKSDSEPTYTM
ncbi:MAG: hypothetical protein LAN37_04990 [Acidobacteriia bacterium]|nr:hypothetical protein [Terriglobia bacterium]